MRGTEHPWSAGREGVNLRGRCDGGSLRGCNSFTIGYAECSCALQPQLSYLHQIIDGCPVHVNLLGLYVDGE